MSLHVQTGHPVVENKRLYTEKIDSKGSQNGKGQSQKGVGKI